ncbi:FkbM family methyltransferase [Pseudonocardia sichuanensis]
MITGTDACRRPTAIGALLRAAAAAGLAEPEVRGLAALVRPGDVCLDVGAAYGMYSHVLAELVGRSGAVHAFEPLPVPSRVLRAGARFTGGVVRPHAAALSETEHDGHELVLPVRFGLPIHGWAHLGGDRVRRALPGRSRSLRVPVRTVDGFCAAQGIDRVAFMKVDVEGAEPAVLAGAASVLARCRPALQLEIEQRHLDRYGHGTQRLVAELRRRYGYRMHTWRLGRWVPATEVGTAHRNYLFLARPAGDPRTGLPEPV